MLSSKTNADGSTLTITGDVNAQSYAHCSSTRTRPVSRCNFLSHQQELDTLGFRVP
jgi:hypothetical protein